MRLSTRLLSNAATTYLRLAATFLLGLFTTWYVLGEVGVVGFGLIALSFSSAGPGRVVEWSLRVGLVREMAAAIASGEARLIQRNVTSAFRLCLQAAVPLAAFVAILAGAAWAGFFNVPSAQPELEVTLALLILAEGIHAAIRLVSAPHLQSLFAAQRVGLDNLLVIVARASNTLSAVVVFGLLLPDASLATRLNGFALSRVTLQLVDVALGIWLAKRRIPGLCLDRSAYDEAEYRAVRSTVWHTSQVEVLLNLNPQFMAVLINLFFGLTYNSIWQIVIQFSSYARILSDGLLRGIEPLITHMQEGGRMRAVIDLVTRTLRYQFAVALPMAILLGLYARPLLELWVGQRLAADPAGIPVSEALDLASTMVWILLAGRVLRAGVYGTERILYGMGRVRSYAWFAKWSTLIAVGGGAALIAYLRQPIVAPVVLLLVDALYSLGVIPFAARRETGLSIGATLRRSLPRPLIASLGFFLLLAPTRLVFDRLNLVSLGCLLLGSALVYGILAWIWAVEGDERSRLTEVARHSFRRMLGWLSLPRGTPPTQ